MSDLAFQVKVIGVVAALSTIALAGAIFFYGQQSRSYTDRLCASQNDSRQVVRNILLLSRAQNRRNRFPVQVVYPNRTEEVVLVFPTLNRGDDGFLEDALKLASPIRC